MTSSKCIVSFRGLYCHNIDNTTAREHETTVNRQSRNDNVPKARSTSSGTSVQQETTRTGVHPQRALQDICMHRIRIYIHRIQIYIHRIQIYTSLICIYMCVCIYTYTLRIRVKLSPLFDARDYIESFVRVATWDDCANPAITSSDSGSKTTLTRHGRNNKPEEEDNSFAGICLTVNESSYSPDMLSRSW